jgi:DNA (cytosine-5)-methyltransferase 1
LFSNCGAGDLGYAKTGFAFDVMAELDPRRLEVCLLNHPGAVGVAGDLRNTWSAVVKKYRSKVGKTRPVLLAACPPCQGMSSARSNRGIESDPDAGMKDKRNLLVTVIANVAKSLRPRIVVVENVPAFLTRQVRHPETEKPITAARLLVEYLSPDYAVFPLLTDLSHHGVPQTRKRTFLTFIDVRLACVEFLDKRRKSPYPLPTHGPRTQRDPITVRQALERMNLPPLDAATPDSARSRFGRGLHAVPVWPDRRYLMVAAIPPNTGGSAWENDQCPRCGSLTVSPSAAVCARCAEPLLRPVVKSRNGRFRLITGFRTSTYSRMKSDQPAATITTASGHIGSNHTIHPYENRLFSTYECALLQTLPGRFNWGDALKKWGHTNVREMIGEAVPPLFTAAHGRILRALLDGRFRVRMCGADHNDCGRAAKKLDVARGRLQK